MPKYSLRYFDVRARGELIRFMLVLKGQEFEDKRFSFENWPAEKPQTPFGHLPVLCINGEDFTESIAIARYLAREFGFFGANHKEGFEIDRYVDMANELLEIDIKIFLEKDEKIKENKSKERKAVTVPRYIADVEKLLSRRDKKGYCVGNSITLGDAAIHELVDGRVTDEELDKYPNIKCVVKNFRSNDKIKAYLQKTGPRPI